MSSPSLAIGIDIGVTSLHVATSPDPRTKPHVIAMKDDAWPTNLLALIPSGETVAYEPTGWHYSAPIVALLLHHGCEVLTVEHCITGKIRDLRISSVKTDLSSGRDGDSKSDRNPKR